MRRIFAFVLGFVLVGPALQHATSNAVSGFPGSSDREARADGSQTASQAQSQGEVSERFVGTWRLISIEGGANTSNRGAKPTGLIYYDATGHMAAQIQPDRDRPRWIGTPTPEQAFERMRGYTAYFGTYTIDEKAGTVTHHRQGMLDPGSVDFVRTFEFAPGDRLILTPVAGTTPPARLTWERIK
jgi:hypothetical protein